MPEDYIFEQDKQFSQFTRTAPISLTAHDLAVRRLASLINDLDYYGRVIKGSYENKTIIWRMLIGYNQTLRQLYIWDLKPLYKEKVDDIWTKLQEAKKMIMEKNKDVIDILEEVEIQASGLIADKKLLFDITEETAETYR
jgi:hypothetical protein